MYLKEITLRDIKCFSEVTLRFPAPGEAGNWCVVLGDNGTGKTTLLQAIALTLAGPGNLLKRPIDWISQGAEFAECKATFMLDSNTKRQTTYTIRNARDLLDETQAFHRENPVSRKDLPEQFLLAGYGALRRMTEGKFKIRSLDELTVADALATLFDDTGFILDLNSLLQGIDHQAKDTDSDKRSQIVAGFWKNAILSVANSLLPAEPPFQVRGVNSRGVSFLAPNGQEVPLAAVSEGYRNVFAFAGDLFLQLVAQTQDPEMFLQAAGSQPFSNLSGIVLIDEVDLHLHPKWQRTIGKALQRVFPKVQFIVATHSPFIAQTAAEGGLSVLRWEEGTVKAESPLPSMHTWPAEEILLGPAFGLDTTRDPEIDALLREYLRLNAMDLRGQLTVNDRKRLKELRKTLKGALPSEGNVYDTHSEIDMLLREAEKDHD